jgi:hypothetical protein
MDEIFEACSTNERGKKSLKNFLVGNNESVYLIDLSVNGWKILKSILNAQHARV